MTTNLFQARTVGELYRLIKNTLSESPLDNFPVEETRMIIEHVLGIHTPQLFAHPETPVSADDVGRVENLLDAYLGGTPLPYLFGEWGFYGMTFAVTPDVLIPREETERLVDGALQWLKAHPDVGEFVDVGTGSGCIGCAVLANAANPSLRAVLVDASAGALSVARANLNRYQLESRAALVQGNLGDPLPPGQRLILANLPYIPSARIATLTIAAAEPRFALDGGPDGFELIRKLLVGIRGKVASPFLILCEIDDTHAEIACDFSRPLFPSARIAIETDYAGKTRYLRIEG